MKRLIATLLTTALLTYAAATPTPAQTMTGQVATLPSVLRALSIVCHREIIADPQLAQLRITATIPLDNCKSALDILSHFYQLQLETLDGYTVVTANAGGRAKVSIHLENASADTVGRALQTTTLIGQDLVVFPDIRDNNIILVGSPQQVQLAEDLVRDADQAPKSGSQAGPSAAELHVLNGDVTTEAKSLQQLYNPAYGPLQISPFPNRAEILVSGAPSAIAAATSLMTIIDKPESDIILHLRVLEIDPHNDQSNIGAIPGGVAPSSSGTGNVTVTPYQAFTAFVTRSIPLNLTINALLQKGQAQILASPDILVRNGDTAGPLHIGQTQPIVTNNGGLVGGTTVTTLDTGITLTATPVASDNGVVHIDLNFGYSQVSGYLNGYPILNNRSLPTFVDVPNGETVTFGGLQEDTTTKTDTSVPILGDIPIFGRLFHDIQTSRNTTQIVFMITPEVKTPYTKGQPFTPEPQLTPDAKGKETPQ